MPHDSYRQLIRLIWKDFILILRRSFLRVSSYETAERVLIYDAIMENFSTNETPNRGIFRKTKLHMTE